MHSSLQGQPRGALLNRRQVPPFLGFLVAGDLQPPGALPEVLLIGLLPFPRVPAGSVRYCARADDDNGGLLGSTCGTAVISARSNESWFVLGPGRQVTYCQGSPSDHTRFSRAAISMHS